MRTSYGQHISYGRHISYEGCERVSGDLASTCIFIMADILVMGDILVMADMKAVSEYQETWQAHVHEKTDKETTYSEVHLTRILQERANCQPQSFFHVTSPTDALEAKLA